MSSDFYFRDNCRLCHSKNVELVIHMEPTPPADKYFPEERKRETEQVYPIDLYLCHDCGHLQLLNVVDPDILYGDYIYVTASSLGLVEHFRRYATDTVEKLGISADSLIVELGSNTGALAKFFKEEHGMRVIGVEPGHFVAELARESGVPTIEDYFSRDLARQIREEHGPAALVVANNVIANIDDINDTMEGIRGLLADDGVFIFEIGYLDDHVEQPLFDNFYHEHLSIFAVRPLDTFMHRHGMEVFDLTRNESKGGSLRGMAQKIDGGHAVQPIVAEIKEMELEKGYDTAAPYQALAIQLDGIKADLTRLLADLKAGGATIAGYGASASVTTTMYHFDIHEYIDYLVDDNPLKQNTFSPGKHIPVYAPDQLYERKPDYVVILPWRYADPIMNNHTAYVEAGGRFIQYLPKVRVVEA